MTQIQARVRGDRSARRAAFRAEMGQERRQAEYGGGERRIETRRDASWQVTEVRLMVLVVEDEASIGALLTDVLEAAGYRVNLALDGRAALALVSCEAPALVLTDRMMPELGGIDLVRRLRASPETRTLPVALMSSTRPNMTRASAPRGKTDTLAITQFVEIDGELVPFLPKPFDLDELVAMVQALAREPGEQRSPQALTSH